MELNWKESKQRDFESRYELRESWSCQMEELCYDSPKEKASQWPNSNK